MIQLATQSTDPARPASGLRLFSRGVGLIPGLSYLPADSRAAFLSRATLGSRRVSLRPAAGGLSTARTNSEWSITPGSTASLVTATGGAAARIDQYTRARLTGTTAVNVSAGLFPCSAPPGYGVVRRREGFIAHWCGAIRTAETAAIASMMGVYAPPIVVADPPAMPNHFHLSLGIADATGDGWSLRRRTGTGTAQRVVLGMPRNNNGFYDITIWAEPDAGAMGARIVDLSTGTVIHNASYTDNLPDPDTYLIFECVASSRSTGVAQIHDILGIDLIWWT